MTWLQSLDSSLLTAAAKGFTMLGEEYLLIFVLGLLYWCVDKDLGRRVSLALTGTMISGTILKGLVLRRRPYMDNSRIKCIRAAHPDADIYSPTEQGFSMPSLHASMSAAVYGTMANVLKKMIFIILGILLPLGIGFSRIYLGVHYPTDVLAGWALGSVFVVALNALDDRFGYKRCYSGILILGAVGFLFCRDSEFYAAWGVTLGILLGLIFEEKYVGFSTSGAWWRYIVRPLVGLVIFALVSAVLKIPGKYISGEMLGLFYRMARYAVSAFVIIGPYPMTFRQK